MVLLAGGADLRRAAEQMSIGVGTARWYLKQALGKTGARRQSDLVRLAEGAGGLYTYAGGEILRTPQSTVYWLTRPRGIHWQADVASLRDRWRDVVVWRRQMVLGPAAEFAVEVRGDLEIEVPPGWQLRCCVKRARLPR